MSRSGYTEDQDDLWAHIRWRGAVKSALRGKRGQAFLREMAAAMDAMPVKRLVAMELEAAGEVCAIGSVGRARGIDMSNLDQEDYATTFGIAECMAQEIVYMNDDFWIWSCNDKGYINKDEAGKSIRITPEERFAKMRAWIEAHISKPSDAQESA